MKIRDRVFLIICKIFDLLDKEYLKERKNKNRDDKKDGV